MKFRDENAVLFFAALSEPGEEVLQRTRACFGRGMDTAYLEQAAENLGVAAGLIELVSRAGIDSGVLSPDLRRAASRELVKTISMGSFFQEVTALFRDAGIPFIPLKGSDRRIAEEARVIVNPMEDIDILVRKSDLGAAHDVLERHGFLFLGALSGAHHNFASAEAHPRFIEVHWDLVNRESPVQRRLFHPDMARIWRDAVPLSSGLHLSPEDLICHTVAHTVKEYFRKPKWAADAECLFRAVLPCLDPLRMRERVVEWGVGPAFGMTALALDLAAGGERLSLAETCGAVRPGTMGRYVAALVFDYGGNRRRRPVIYAACARSAMERVSLVGDMARRLVGNFRNR